jgi:threonine dehydratase
MTKKTKKLPLPIKFSDIVQAEQNLRQSGLVYPARLKYCNYLSKKYNANFYHVIEILQVVKSFKIRGACNKLMSLTPEERKKGVICASAGNHAQGTAATSTKLGIKSYICMPSNAPLAKITATKNFGGNVILADQPSFDAAYALSKKLAKEKGLIEIPPYDDEKVIAGQATIALEVLQQNPNIDTFIVPIGGGGLISGIAICAKIINPNIKIIGVQAENFPAMKMSKQKGKLISYATGKPTLADGCAVKTPGNITFKIVQQLVDQIVTVTEDEIIEAITLLSDAGKIVAEGAGAMPTAAIISGKVKVKDTQNVALLVSGGNIDTAKYYLALSKGLQLLNRKVKLEIEFEDANGVKEFCEMVAKNNGTAYNILTENQVCPESKPGKYSLFAIFLDEKSTADFKAQIKTKKYNYKFFN